MARRDRLNLRNARSWALLPAVLALGVGGFGPVQPAKAAVTAVRGSACGYITNVGLFRGPPELLGCGQAADAPATAASPFVTLPAAGSTTPITAADPDGAQAEYGPATLFGGRWPENVQSAPPSGPITVSTKGTPAEGSVTSSADIGRFVPPITVGCATGSNPPCTAPGGFGPVTVEGDSLHTECTATEAGVTGSTRFVNAKLATATDQDGNPTELQDIPENPPVNYTREGTITHVGDRFTVVFNEHVRNDDGSLTVNGVHMKLLGPTAVGDVFEGQVTCGVAGTGSPTDRGTGSATDGGAGTIEAAGQTGGRSGGAGTTTTAAGSGSGNRGSSAGGGATTTTARSSTATTRTGMAQTGNDVLPWVLVADAMAIGGLVILLLTRRPRRKVDAEEPLPYVRR